MAETSELRLKINAAAARAGSREFVAAINAIKKSVLDLDKTSDGAFKRLSRNAKDAAASSKVKISPVDRSSIRTLDQFAKMQAQAIRQTANTRRGLSLLMDSLRTVAAGYTTAKTANDAYAQSVARANSALSRQADLAARVASATRASGASATAASTGTTSRGTDRAANQQVAMQNRVKRAVDDTTLSVERLTTSLMKVGGFQSIQQIGAAFRQFQREVSSSTLTAQQFDAAKTRLNTTIKSAQTSLVTLTAKVQEEARAERAAADAARVKARAQADAASTAKAEAAAIQAANSAMSKQEALNLSAAAAIRRAQQEVATLIERMRRIGDTRGIAELSTALNNLRTSVGSGVNNMNQLRTATAAYNDVVARSRINITQTEAAQQRAARSASELARQEREAAAAAAQVERQMRSVAGASNAVSRALRDATGSMRGLENAFSGTYQIGSAFRTLIGSITLGTFTKQVFAAGSALEQFRVTMQVATGSIAGASQEIDFIDDLARRLGTNLRGAREDFAKFAVSASLAGVETNKTREIFESVAMAMSVMGRGAEDQRLAFLALEQMLSKNVVSSEELRRQLGERLPGAVNLMAKAVGVSTAELQKMLKAGELVSSEVLPKFAKEVQAAFGPGFAAATRRASYNLGTLQVEFEKLLEGVANSGFMNALASGFRELTIALQNPEVQGAAQRLGEGFADLARIAIDFGVSFVENIETVGKVARAVIGGVLIRQAVLLGNAMVTAAQRSAIGFATLVSAITGETAVTTANTAATTANTVAKTGNAAATVKSAVAVEAELRAIFRDTAAKNVATGVTARLAAATTAAGAAAGRFALGLGVASRVLVGLAGPIGIAVTALSLIPVIFGDIGGKAESMAKQVESAIERSGASFDDLGARAARANSSIELSRTLTDIETLGQAASAFAEDNSMKIRGLQLAIQQLNGELVNTKMGYEAMGNIAALGNLFGEDALTLESFSNRSKDVIRDLAEMTQVSLQTGGGFLELRDAIAEAITQNPSAAPILQKLAAMTEQLALSELALTANREKLVELYGTADDRLVKSFADSARAVVNTGQGLDDLRRRMRSVAADAPQIKDQLAEVFSAVEESLASGGSEGAFRQRVLGIFGQAAAEIERYRQAAQEAEKAAGAAAQKFAQTVTQNLEGLDGLNGIFTTIVPEGQIEQIRALSDEFERFRDFSVTFDQVRSVMSGIEFPTEAARSFADELLRQFQQLPEGQRTYAELSRIMGQLGANYPTNETASFEAALRTALRTGKDASLSTEEYVRSLEVLRDSMPTDEAKELVQGMIDAAKATGDAGIAANAATAGMEAAAAAARDAGAAGRDGASGMQALLNAFNAISGAGYAAAASIGAEIRDVQRQIDLKKMDYVSRETEQAMDKYAKDIREQRTNIQNAYNTALSGITGQGEGLNGPLAARAKADRDAALATLDESEGMLRAKYKELAETETNNAGKPGGSKGGGGGRSKALGDESKQIKNLINQMNNRIFKMEQENTALSLLASGQAATQESAELMAAAMKLGGGAIDETTMAMVRQYEQAVLLNQQLQKLAKDPVKDWLAAVPTWREAGRQIETEVFDSLSDTIANFIKTGEFSFEALGESILSAVADIVADKAVKELVTLLGGNIGPGGGEGGFGLGGILASMFGMGGSMGDAADPILGGGLGGAADGAQMQTAIIAGSTQGAEIMRTAIVSSASAVGSSIQTGGSTAAAQMSTAVNTSGATAGATMATAVTTSTATGGATMGTAITSASATGAAAMGGAIATASGASGGGGGGGGFFSAIFGEGGFFSSFFAKDGGISSSPTSYNVGPIMPASAFRNAPHYAQGTPNTSGIPAMLHDNEAVIPLSGNRKVPVELGTGAMGGGGGTIINQNWNITTPDADSFRRSKSQTLAEAAAASRKALNKNG